MTDSLTHLTPTRIHQALEIYLRHAYPGQAVPAPAQELLPPEGEFDLPAWLGQDMAETDPPGASPAEARSVAIRLGNFGYPNMKLRLSRPPADECWLLSVDSHDAILQAPEGSPDQAMLEELKAHNAQLKDAIMAAWEQANLPTERTYLRHKITQARQAEPPPQDSDPHE
jgi:hypothetical protein